MMRIAYITKVRFSSPKAHVHTIAKTCEAMNSTPDTSVVLVSTDSSLLTSREQETFFKRHDVTNAFQIDSLNTWASKVGEERSVLRFRFAALLSQLALMSWLWRHRHTIDVVYARDHLLLLPLLFARFVLGKPYVFEAHFVLSKRLGQWFAEQAVRHAVGVVAITKGLASHYYAYSKRILVSYCAGANEEAYRFPKKKNEYRAELSLPEDRVILGYAGNVSMTGNGDSYGLEDIVAALPLLPEQILLIAVGKREGEHVPGEELAQKLGIQSRVLFLPRVQRSLVPKYVLASDILVIPASGAQVGNSPTKIFEDDLVSGVPMVAANTPPIAEILRHEENALLVQYKSPQAWADAILRLIRDGSLRSRLAEQAQRDSALYTWQQRGQHIVQFVRDSI